MIGHEQRGEKRGKQKMNRKVLAAFEYRKNI